MTPRIIQAFLSNLLMGRFPVGEWFQEFFDDSSEDPRKQFVWGDFPIGGRLGELVFNHDLTRCKKTF